MAEGGGDSWFGGWVKAAKEKSGEVFDFMKRDLTEFSTVVQKDTATAVASTATTVKEKLHVEQSATGGTLKEGLSNFLGAISRSLAVDDDDVEEIRIGPASPTAVYGRAQARLHNMQIDPGTYCNEPDGPQDQYFKWLETFDLEGIKGDISDLLVAKNEVRALYTRLVPSAVSHSEFWQRYFYKLHQLQQDEARRAALMERADNTSPSDDLGWEDDEDEWGWETPDAATLPAISEGAITTQQVLEEEPSQESVTREAELVVPEEDRRSSAVSSDESSELVMLDKPSSEASASSDEASVTMDEQTMKRGSPTSSDSSDVVVVERPNDEDTGKKESEKIEAQAQGISPSDNAGEGPKVPQENVEKVPPKDANDQKHTAERTEPKRKESSDTEKIVDAKADETIMDTLATKLEAQVRIPSEKVEETLKTKPTEKSEEKAPESKSSDKVEDKAPKTEPQVPEGDKEVKEVVELLAEVKGEAKEGEVGRASPASAGGSSGAKDSSESLSDDWEKDFDLDLTEEEMRIAQAALEKDGKDTGDLDDDWESWE